MNAADTLPFKRSESGPKRLKILVFGESGTGKTRLLLSFPRLALIDTEGGTDYYTGDYHVLRTQDPDEIRRTIDRLSRGGHEFTTLAVDSFSVVWGALQEKWNRIFREQAGGRQKEPHEYLEFGPREWLSVKADHRDLVGRLLRLDMNVVLTCRSRSEYETNCGEQISRVGTTYEGEKTLAYAVDIVLELFRTAGKTMAQARKDRTGKLPEGLFEVSGDLFQRTYPGMFAKPATPAGLATHDQIARVDALTRALGFHQAQVLERLKSMGFESLDQLTRDAAGELTRGLEALLKKNKEQQTRGGTQNALRGIRSN